MKCMLVRSHTHLSVGKLKVHSGLHRWFSISYNIPTRHDLLPIMTSNSQ